MGFLIFAVKCFDVLAWPLVALGYPLCASIRAIESNSNSEMQKLITYWILFSLNSLFELGFVKLIEWLPFWPYLKLIATGWLVLPSFGGAYHVYDCLVRPLLSVNPQAVINQFNKPKEGLSLKTEDFLAMADRFVKENGYEALEKFIAIKGAKPINDVEEIKAVANTKTEKKEVATATQVDCRDTIAVAKELNCKEPNVAQKHMKGVEMAEKKEAAMANRVKCAEPNLEQAEKRTVEDVQIKEMTAAADRENRLPEITISKEVQKEWTCAACQMTMPSEANLNSHLQGRKHKAKCEELKGGKQTDKNMSSSYSTTNESDQTNREPKKRARRRQKKSGTTTQEEKVQVGGTSDWCKQKNMMNIDAGTKSTFWCSICNVMCPDEIHMASHLSGWNQSPIQEMFGFGGGATHGMCPDEIHMASHLSGWNQSPIQEMFGFGGGATHGMCPDEIHMASHLSGWD